MDLNNLVEEVGLEPTTGERESGKAVGYLV
jgi:hypothetical protein